MREKNIFSYMASPVYHAISKKVKNQIFRHNWIFRHKCVYKQTALIKQWNYNILVQIFYSYFRYIGRPFLGCAVFVASCNIISFMRNQEGIKIELQKKKYKKELCERHHFFDCTPSRLYHFLLLSSSTLLRKSRTCWLIPIKIHNISMVFCVIWKKWKPLAI